MVWVFWGLGFRVWGFGEVRILKYWGYIGVILGGTLGIYWDNGKYNGNYYSVLGRRDLDAVSKKTAMLGTVALSCTFLMLLPLHCCYEFY